MTEWHSALSPTSMRPTGEGCVERRRIAVEAGNAGYRVIGCPF